MPGPWPEVWGMVGGSAVALVGVGVLVAAWLWLGRLVGTGSRAAANGVTPRDMVTTLLLWAAPLILTAPLFSQDIYSYLAQGAIVRHGFDPYWGGPVDLLGPLNPLAKNVPAIWAHSPSPYGPVALAAAAAISRATGDAIFTAVVAHRTISLLGVLAAAWASVHLGRRLGVGGPSALWLGICNPLAILHLIGGIHNEALMLGFLLVGLEIGCRGLERLRVPGAAAQGWALFLCSGALISCAGLVKVTGFIGLGFMGMALARELAVGNRLRARSAAPAIAAAAAIQSAVLGATATVASIASGVGFGWAFVQGGAAQIRSWLSLTTSVGLIAGQLSESLGFGDTTDSAIAIARGTGATIAVFCQVVVGHFGSVF
ncbi:polyprenol phosphomannose-dependent alpha 1,6 mannosyltransferase MptB [Corynebacterium aquatimens]|nr:polyprenol phosphomannose-dependent alpha 1,6 mannosyltransferase MptB [Corynebacterium aquatimens]